MSALDGENLSIDYRTAIIMMEQHNKGSHKICKDLIFFGDITVAEPIIMLHYNIFMIRYVDLELMYFFRICSVNLKRLIRQSGYSRV